MGITFIYIYIVSSYQKINKNVKQISYYKQKIPKAGLGFLFLCLKS